MLLKRHLTLLFQLWVAYAPCGAQHKDAVQVTLEQIDLIKRLVESYPNQLQLVKTSEGKAFQSFSCPHTTHPYAETDLGEEMKLLIFDGHERKSIGVSYSRELRQ